MLSIQAEMCFPFEYSFYKDLHMDKIKNVVEVGCGNGNYLRILKTHFPNAIYEGLDHCEEFIKIARQTISDDLNIKHASLEGLTNNHDLIILRLVLHQIEDRISFIKKLSEVLNNDSQVIVIESWDVKFRLYPTLVNFLNHLKRHRDILSPNTASRHLKDCLKEEMKKVGLILDKENYYYVPSTLPGYKEKYYSYMLATSKIIGCSEEVIRDINAWYYNPAAYAQIGLFISNFKKEKVRDKL